MYKPKKYPYLAVCKKLAYTIKRKITLIIAAFMIGISNVILEEERMVNDTTDKIEHVQNVKDTMKD